MAKILLIEDDEKVQALLKAALSANQHSLELAGDVGLAMALLDSYAFDLVIVDWQLPDGTGVDIIERLRSRSCNVPILMLTGKGAISDKEIGFGAGADDYLTKPFDLKELNLRVQALLRRPHDLVARGISIGDMLLIENSHAVEIDGQSIFLNKMEFELLAFLMKRPGTFFTSESLLNRLWPSDSDASVGALRACVKRLRSRLDECGRGACIESVRNVGYRFEFTLTGTGDGGTES